VSTPVLANATGVVVAVWLLVDPLLLDPLLLEPLLLDPLLLDPCFFEPLSADSVSCFGAGAGTFTVTVGPGTGTSTVVVGPGTGTSTVVVGPGTVTVSGGGGGLSSSPAIATPVSPKAPTARAIVSADPVARIRFCIVVPPLLLVVG